MYVVLGATGKTGGVVAEKLLAAGARVRVVGRDAKRLERFTQKGAEGFAADVADVTALEKAFTGAKAIYAMIPPNNSSPDVRAYQELVTDALSDAIRKAGTTHVVALTSTGSDKADKVGPVVGLHNFEEKLKKIEGLNALFVRAGYFMDNLMIQTGIIQSFGLLAGPLRPDLPLAMIAPRDIGAFAADVLTSLSFSGKHSQELQGASDVTYDQAAKIIGAAIGKPDLAYKRMPAAVIKPGMMQMGMSSNMADLLLEMAEAQNSGFMKPLEPRSTINSTPTSLETFVNDTFVPAYHAKLSRT